MVVVERAVNSLEKSEAVDGLGVGENLSRLILAVSHNASSVVPVLDLRFVTFADRVLPVATILVPCVAIPCVAVSE